MAASGESQYDDAFTIQRVEKCQVDEFNYVAGMVPFLLNLVKDVRNAVGHSDNLRVFSGLEIFSLVRCMYIYGHLTHLSF